MVTSWTEDFFGAIKISPLVSAATAIGRILSYLVLISV
jgi:hypothetical protein